MELVLSVIHKFAEFDCYSFLHTRFEEIPALLDKHSHEVDVWLFSGPLPYATALDYRLAQGREDWPPMFAIPFSETSLYRTLCGIFYTKPIRADELSYDVYEQSQLLAVFADLGAEGVKLQCMPYQGSYHDLIDFHVRNWESGLTKGAVTCVWYVAQQLEKLAIPVYRVIPTDSTIEAVLGSILLKLEGLRYRDMQIAVLRIETELLAIEDEKVNHTADTASDNEGNDVYQELLSYSKQIQGSLLQAGSNLFTLYTTRGAVRDLTDHFRSIPEQWDSRIMLCGIGIGRTAYEAGRLADEGLARSRIIGEGSWLIFFDDKTVTGPLGKPEHLSFSYVSDKLQSISGGTSLSAATLSKVDAIMRKLGTDEVNANELAQHMSILPRSARRILSQLESEGLAQAVGEESPHTRGRPLKTYRISFRQR